MIGCFHWETINLKSSLSAIFDRLAWDCLMHAACRRNESLLRRLKEGHPFYTMAKAVTRNDYRALCPIESFPSNAD
jgi:hypothetical protein